MLMIAQNKQDKTILGLMGYLPYFKQIDHLNQEMAWYEANDNRKIFLWKANVNEDVNGALGVEFLSQDQVLVRHISLTPKFRKEAVAIAMLDDLKMAYNEKFIMGTIETQPFISMWVKHDLRKQKRLHD